MPTQVATVSTSTGSRFGWWLVLGCIPVGLALIVAGKFVSNPDYQAMTFFGGGGLLLTAGLAAAWTWMKRTRHATVNGRGLPALGQLGSRNAARNPTRSLLTAALLAAAAFLLVAVESFRRQSEALQREQLIDLILSIETYTKPSYIDPHWIVSHIGLWGGLANRLPNATRNRSGLEPDRNIGECRTHIHRPSPALRL